MKLSNIKQTAVDTKAITDGQWKGLGDPFGDVEIMTRGLGDAYTDALNRRLRSEARNYRNDINRIPMNIFRRIRVSMLIDHVWMDVRNLFEDDGKTPVSWQKFCDDVLRKADQFPDIVDACVAAAESVGKADLESLESAKGN